MTRPTGRLYAVGVGPGDPELLTLKAARLISAAQVVAYHSGPRGASIARSIVADLIPAGTTEELLSYPVTTGEIEHPGGYYGAMSEFYDSSAARLAAHLDAGRDVVVLAEGDPLFYSSYGYLHDRLAHRYVCEVVPGVTSLSATAAAASEALGRHEDVLTVLPGTLPVPELASRLAGTDAVMIMKLGRSYAGVLEALEQAGRLGEAIYVERASTAGERVRPAAAVEPGSVPYFSMIMVPGRDRRADWAGRAPASDGSAAGPDRSATAELLVVGLGPGGDSWLTTETTQALSTVDHVVGYRPYLERIPQRRGLRKHPSGNTVELGRARAALDLARAGERVAVVSGGDAGVFGMASAVYEAAEDPRYADVTIRVLPGVTAAQAVAARAGAPLGADYAVLSLSDRRKPWSVIEDRLRAAAAADLVIAIYNPASRTRATQVKEAKEILLAIRDGQHPGRGGAGRRPPRRGADRDQPGRSGPRLDRHALSADHRGQPDPGQPEPGSGLPARFRRLDERVRLLGESLRLRIGSQTHPLAHRLALAGAERLPRSVGDQGGHPIGRQLQHQPVVHHHREDRALHLERGRAELTLGRVGQLDVGARAVRLHQPFEDPLHHASKLAPPTHFCRDLDPTELSDADPPGGLGQLVVGESVVELEQGQPVDERPGRPSPDRVTRRPQQGSGRTCFQALGKLRPRQGSLRHQPVDVRVGLGEHPVGVHEGLQRFDRRARGRLDLGRFERCCRFLEAVDDDRHLECLFVREVLVQRRSPDAEPLREPPHGQGLRPLALQQLASHVDDLSSARGQGVSHGQRSRSRPVPSRPVP